MKAMIQNDRSLKIQVDDEYYRNEYDSRGYDERLEILALDGYYDRQEYVMDGLGQGWEMVRPEELGALTDSPIIARSEDLIRDTDTNELIGIADSATGIWWFPDYQVQDPWEALARDGEVVFVNGMDRFVQHRVNELRRCEQLTRVSSTRRARTRRRCANLLDRGTRLRIYRR